MATAPPLANGVRLTGTTAQTVLADVPPYTVPCRVEVSLTVVQAATVTLAASWTDPALGPQGYTWENGTSLPVGIRFELPLVVQAQGGTAVTVTAQAGVADAVQVTGRITRLWPIEGVA